MNARTRGICKRVLSWGIGLVRAHTLNRGVAAIGDRKQAGKSASYFTNHWIFIVLAGGWREHGEKVSLALHQFRPQIRGHHTRLDFNNEATVLGADRRTCGTKLSKKPNRVHNSI